MIYSRFEEISKDIKGVHYSLHLDERLQLFL